MRGKSRGIGAEQGNEGEEQRKKGRKSKATEQQRKEEGRTYLLARRSRISRGLAADGAGIASRTGRTHAGGPGSRGAVAYAGAAAAAGFRCAAALSSFPLSPSYPSPSPSLK